MTMGEKSAVKAVAALNPKVVIPIHLGLTPHSFLLQRGESPEGFRRRMQATGNPASVMLLADGAALNL
jgi:L-ascorbate metabolism protein UlaG (beta-lactamase superfamily)